MGLALYIGACAPLPPSGTGTGGGAPGTGTQLPGGAPRDGKKAPPRSGPEREVGGAYTSGSTASGARAGADAAPGHDFDAHAVPDAVPIDEPRSRYGNKSPYVVFGKTYTVLADASGYNERGVASWYGAKFHGAKTSSGEPYDMYAMSAAHKTLPLPCYARVTNLETGASVIVRVNDRGPFKDNRVMDLSYAAATRLGITAKGTGQVEVRVVGPGDVVAVPEGASTVKALDDFGVGAPVPYSGDEPAPTPAPAPTVAAAAVAATSKPAPLVRGPETVIAPLTAGDMALKAPAGATPAPKPAPAVTTTAIATVTAPAVTAPAAPAPKQVRKAPKRTASAPKRKASAPKPAPAAAAPAADTLEVVAVANPFNPPSPPGSAATAKPMITPPSMWLQVGAFGDEANANRVRVRLAASGLPTATKAEVDATGKKLFKIRVGPFDDASALDAAAAKLTALDLKQYKTVIE